MKVGIYATGLQAYEFEEMLDVVRDLGAEAVELGVGIYPRRRHVEPAEVLGRPAKIQAVKDAMARRGLVVSGVSCHSNPLHPDEAIASRSDEAYHNAVRLAAALEVGVVNLFSGCPGGGPDDKVPNWVTCPWPPDFSQALEWQWNERIIPYWRRTAPFAQEHGVRLAFEMHPGFSVYNPPTLLRLREAVGPVVGANFDPSHLFWQGIDPVAAIRKLKGAIYHFHAKDTYIDPYNCAADGVLDTRPYSDLEQRSWIFRSVG
ncbi:MAG: sugar phosphate isomerase/epimerase, partial [Chloroflexi bacterium]|nr:sugar phosphate isomerase/epimerase [Chloroflexota bacterium]